MSFTASFGEQLDALGIWWPRGDGDALRESARAWTELADLIGDIAAVLDAAATSVVENYRGPAAERFWALWQCWTTDTGYLAATVLDCQRLAAALTDFGTDIDVADRTLLHLVEEALTAGTPEYLDWLRVGAASIGNVLARQVHVRCDDIARIDGIDDVRQPDIPDSIDPGAITWPDPGTPDDLSFLITTPIDLGAGPGLPPPGGQPPEIQPPWQPPPVCGPPVEPPPPAEPPVAEPPATPPPCDPAPIDPDAPIGTVPVEPGDWSTVEPPVARSVPEFDDVSGAGMLREPGDAGEPAPPVGSVAGGGSIPGGAGFGAALGGLGALGGAALGGSKPTPLGLGPLPSTDAPKASPPRVPIDITPPTGPTSRVAPPSAATAKGGGSGRMPFFPFMPMGAGGSTGDDGEEPKRRSASGDRAEALPSRPG
jgi:hypothetical protein